VLVSRAELTKPGKVDKEDVNSPSRQHRNCSRSKLAPVQYEPRREENSHIPRSSIKTRLGDRRHAELGHLEQLGRDFEAHNVCPRRERQKFSESHVLLIIVGDKVVVGAFHANCYRLDKQAGQ